jgi:hypothetical protein
VAASDASAATSTRPCLTPTPTREEALARADQDRQAAPWRGRRRASAARRAAPFGRARARGCHLSSASIRQMGCRPHWRSSRRDIVSPGHKGRVCRRAGAVVWRRSFLRVPGSRRAVARPSVRGRLGRALCNGRAALNPQPPATAFGRRPRHEFPLGGCWVLAAGRSSSSVLHAPASPPSGLSWRLLARVPSRDATRSAAQTQGTGREWGRSAIDLPAPPQVAR